MDYNYALNHDQIRELIEREKLIEGYLHLDTQLTPNGFDLTAANIYIFGEPGALDFSNKERMIPQARELLPEKKDAADKYGWWSLKSGIYKVLTNEKVNLPGGLIALAFSRTSLLRMGAYTQHGVWDAGFKGRGEFILSVGNPAGMMLKQNSRIAQLVFVRIKEASKVYDGIYQNK